MGHYALHPQINAGVLGVAGKIKITAIGNSFQFEKSAFIQSETVFNIRSGAGIMRKLVFGMVAKTYVFLPDSKRQKPVHPHLPDIAEILIGFFRTTKEFKIHLLKFPCSKQKISRRNFITKRLANLRNAKRQNRMK